MYDPCFVMQCFLSRVLVALLNGLNAVIWAVSVLCLFLTDPWVGLQCVIVAFSGHTLLFY